MAPGNPGGCREVRGALPPKRPCLLPYGGPAPPDGSLTGAEHSRFADAAPPTGRAAGGPWEVPARGHKAFRGVSAYADAYADALSGSSRPSR
ncbi:hypothetical protein ABZT34_18625 [Streptomyces sp. NPDC005329]|uniref:hypothetical protein n=1 Tax=Streptomyces sp. NPDC005329 TaxID=3157034 RepID=UPI0033B16E34